MAIYAKTNRDNKVDNRMSKKKQKFDLGNESAVVQHEFGNRKRFHPHDLINLKPLNIKQEEFLRLFYEGTDLLVASGSSGVGKSFLAMYCALSEVFRSDTPYEKVILARSAVQTRDIGFLSGNLEEKASVMENPYRTICKDLIPKYKEGYTHLKSLGYLEFHLTSFLRGETFDNAIVLVDEAAAMNYHELSTITTRVGQDSRLIVCGDIKQDDLASKGKRSDVSGFAQYLNTVERMPASMVGIVNYTVEDIVRSGLVKEFLIADQ